MLAAVAIIFGKLYFFLNFPSFNIFIIFHLSSYMSYRCFLIQYYKTFLLIVFANGAFTDLPATLELIWSSPDPHSNVECGLDPHSNVLKDPGDLVYPEAEPLDCLGQD